MALLPSPPGRGAGGEGAFAAWCLFLVLTACGGEPQPVPIVYDEDACSHCRMAVSQPAFAAELVTPGGQVELFDDLGCLAAWLREHPPPAGSGLFVADYESHDWFAAPDATYLVSPELPTPMGSGLAAFHDRSAAETLAAQLGGRLLTWEEVLTEAAP